MLDSNIVFITAAINDGRWADAVKGIRDYFGHALKESLEIVKAYDGDEDIVLSPAQTATLNKLKPVAKVLKG